MISLKVLLYAATLGAAFFFAILEMRLKRRVADDSVIRSNNPGDFGVLNTLNERMERERIVESQPPQALRKYRWIVALKFIFVVIFVIELAILQR